MYETPCRVIVKKIVQVNGGYGVQTTKVCIYFATCFIVLDGICLYEIRGSHGANYEDAVLGDVMLCSLVVWVPTVSRKLLLLSWMQT